MGLLTMKRYRHLFFDLDHTLWDFRSNSREALRELVADHDLIARGIPSAEAFIEAYEEINHALWAEHGAGRMPKEVLRVLRFRTGLQRFGITDGRLPGRLSEEYLERCPRKTSLMPGTLEMLRAAASNHRMHIITNGFEEVQHVKLRNSGINDLFELVLTSERAGAAKPHAAIFREALRRTGASASESVMIGDNSDTDMLGARNAGWDHIHYAAETEPDTLATHRVAHHDELRRLLA